MAITDIPNYQQQLDFVNAQVKQLLVDSDYTQLPDAPYTVEQKQVWATYREKLRNLSKDPNYPFVALPIPPQV
jgi:hypothetical protein